jgi:putative ABC transport system permease protein
MMLLELTSVSIVQGLVLALVALGVMIPYRLLNFPDLSAEGSYPFGACLTATLLLQGYSFPLCMLIAVIGSGLLGICTALIHIRFRVNTLLCGIIVSTMIYSVNLRLMGQSNISLFEISTLFTPLANKLQNHMSILFLIVLALLLPLLLFLQTETGLRLRAVGLHPNFAERQGISMSFYQCLGLFIASSISGLAGSLMAQMQQYADMSMGLGIVVHGLASLMLGEAFLGQHSLMRQLAAPLIGSLMYQEIQGLALVMGLSPNDLPFLTGATILCVLFMRRRTS